MTPPGIVFRLDIADDPSRFALYGALETAMGSAPMRPCDAFGMAHCLLPRHTLPWAFAAFAHLDMVRPGVVPQ
jgi:hypothetical protein